MEEEEKTTETDEGEPSAYVDEETLRRLQVSFEHTVQPNEVNALGIICYGSYPGLFDSARLALFKTYGYTETSDASKEHWFMPVIGFSLKILGHAKVGDVIEVRAWWHTIKGVRAWMGAEVYAKATGQIIARGYTEHCFVDDRTLKPVKPDPGWRICLRQHDFDVGIDIDEVK